MKQVGLVGVVTGRRVGRGFGRRVGRGVGRAEGRGVEGTSFGL